jgi:hypothetical protein
MIGDEQVFDAIILEFSPYRGEPYKNFELLVKRIRARFPSAILIWLFLPMPLHDIYYRGTVAMNYIESLKLTSQDDPMFATTVRNLTNFLTWNPINSIEMYNATIHSVGGFTVVSPVTLYENFTDYILDNAKYFGNKGNPWDFVHPNALGHQRIADQLRESIQQHLSMRPPLLLPPHMLGEWLMGGGKDACISWYLDANAAKEMNVTGMTLSRFPAGRSAGLDRGWKWALEVDRMGGTMSVDCSKYHSSCNIYLPYMAYGPNKIYPRVAISVQGRGYPNVTTVMVNPHIPVYHCRKTVYVGTVHHSTRANVTVIPLPEDANATKGRFRITGIIVTPFLAVLDRHYSDS